MSLSVAGLVAGNAQPSSHLPIFNQNLKNYLKLQLLLIIYVGVHTIIYKLFVVAFHESLKESMNTSVV